jgi:hypothetical protein
MGIIRFLITISSLHAVSFTSKFPVSYSTLIAVVVVVVSQYDIVVASLRANGSRID